jgi:hypothetical protein
VGGNTIKFENTLVSGSIKSSYFFFRDQENEIRKVYIADTLTKENTSIISLYEFGTDSTVVSNLGTINYHTGVISISSLNIAGYIEGSDDIRINAEPFDLDLYTSRDLILVIDDSILDVNIGTESGLTINVTQE